MRSLEKWSRMVGRLAFPSRKDGRAGGAIDGWMYGWMDGWMDEWMSG